MALGYPLSRQKWMLGSLIAINRAVTVGARATLPASGHSGETEGVGRALWLADWTPIGLEENPCERPDGQVSALGAGDGVQGGDATYKRFARLDQIRRSALPTKLRYRASQPPRFGLLTLCRTSAPGR